MGRASTHDMVLPAQAHECPGSMRPAGDFPMTITAADSASMQ